jgi:hypothetical protein
MHWQVVEDMAANGDQLVENAVRVSLIEWFAWGDEHEPAVLRDARPLQGPALVSHRGVMEEVPFS